MLMEVDDWEAVQMTTTWTMQLKIVRLQRKLGHQKVQVEHL